MIPIVNSKSFRSANFTHFSPFFFLFEVNMIDKQLAQEISCAPKQVSTCLELLEGGATVPFIARYRKEKTGGLLEEQIRTIEKRHAELKEFAKRKEYICTVLEKAPFSTRSVSFHFVPNQSSGHSTTRSSSAIPLILPLKTSSCP